MSFQEKCAWLIIGGAVGIIYGNLVLFILR